MMYGEVSSTFQRKPCYRYIRKTDRLPSLLTNITLDSPCKIRLFNPTGIGTWWIAAYDPDDELAYGVVELDTREMGYIHTPELVAFRGRFGLPIERDLHYRPQTIAQILAEGNTS